MVYELIDTLAIIVTGSVGLGIIAYWVGTQIGEALGKRLTV